MESMDIKKKNIGGYNKRLFLNNSLPDFTVPIFINLEKEIESKGKKRRKKRRIREKRRQTTERERERERERDVGNIIQIEILINLNIKSLFR